MEQYQSDYNVIFHPILPFMDKLFFENLLKSENFQFTDLQIINGEFNLPSKITNYLKM
jgi:hypothetical protein